jgi:hypothetical protein
VSKPKILRHYVSEIDNFLTQFDQEHPERSLSQQKEVAKFQRIYHLRDDPEYTEIPTPLWDKF